MDFLKITLYDKQVYQHRNCLPCLKNARIHFWGKKKEKNSKVASNCVTIQKHTIPQFVFMLQNSQIMSLALHFYPES